MTISPPTATKEPVTSSYTFNYNPKGLLPGQGPRSLEVTFEKKSDDTLKVQNAYYGPSLINPSFRFRSHRYMDGNTNPELIAAANALAGAMNTLDAKVRALASQDNDVDNGMGWAKNNTFGLLTGSAGYSGTKYFYGKFGKESRPAVAEAANLFYKFASVLAHKA